MGRVSRILNELIERTRAFALPEADREAATEFLEQGEYELCLDQLITQLYEYELPIDQPYWELTEKAAIELEIAPDKFNYLKELVKTDS